MIKNFQFFPSSPWSTARDTIPQETFDLERKPQYVYVDIHGAELVELRNRIEKLEERLEQQKEQQVIPINFWESDKLKLKKAFNVVLEHHLKDNLYIVDCPELDIYGEGQDRMEALNDFNLALEETYLSLKEDKDKLGPQPKREWEVLKELIEEK